MGTFSDSKYATGGAGGMQKFFLIIGIILSGLSVVLGAFGAHALKKVAPPDAIATYQTGVQYQIFHAIAILIVGVLAEKYANSFVHYAGILFLLGIVLFSGSLYVIVASVAHQFSLPTIINLLTPIGGLFFILGWVLLLAGVIKK